MRDRVEEIRTRHFLLAFVAFFLAILIPGAIFWMHFGQHASRCVYGDPICSLTVSTYLLCFLTVLAFLAAYKAARYAQKTLQMERAVILSLNRCSALEADGPEGEKAPEQRGIIFDHRPFRKEQRYLRVIDEGFQDREPEKFNRKT